MVSVLSTQASRCTNLHRTANKIKQGSKSSHTLVSTASLYLFYGCQRVARPHLGATRPRVGIAYLGFDALTSKYNTFSYCQVGVSSPNLAMPTRGRVAPR